jgi:hypothetical protein
VAYNFKTGNKKIKLFTGYESVTQKVLFGNAVLAIDEMGRACSTNGGEEECI